MEDWLQEYLQSERDSMFQNNFLNLPNRRIKQIDWIPDNKYSINLSFNNLDSLPTLHAYIESLNISHNSLTNLPLLPRRLQYLNIDSNPLLHLPDLPAKLKVLRASCCSLLSLPDLPKYLECLNVGFNHLMNIPPLPEGLNYLDVQENNLSELPYLPETLEVLRIDGNPGLQRFYGKKLHEIRELVKRELAKKRCRTLKRDLMEAAWHPRRIGAWLEVGFDPDD